MQSKHKQQGVVLVIGLLMLLVITVVGLSAMSSTSSNERSTGNNQLSTLSFQASESAVKSMFSRPDVEPTIMDIDISDGTLANQISQLNNYDVDLSSAAGATVSVQATSLASFCGGDPLQVDTSLASGSQDSGGNESLVFDVSGSSVIGGTGAQENHLRSGKLTNKALGFSFNGAGTMGSCIAP